MGSLSDAYRKLHDDLPLYLYLFPLVAGFAWFTTLSVMLGYWLAIGRPTFPGQSNPYVSFISDIAAFHLKPFFITGCTVTSIAFIGTVFGVNYARRSARFHSLPGRQSMWRELLSLLTLISGTIAGVSLFLLALFDTVREHRRHQVLLLSTFGGLGITALGTGALWGDVWMGRSAKRRERLGSTKRSRRLRIWCAINFAFMCFIVLLGVAFTVFLFQGYMRTAGVLEWVIAFSGSFWLLSFVGLLLRLNAPSTFNDDDSVSEDDEATSEESERRPLLEDQ